MKFDTKKSLFILLFFAIGITSCREGNSIYNPEYEPSKADPVITSITPEDGYLSGIDSIIVHGENFSDDVDEMTISFDGQTGTILSATPTKLGVRPAQIIGDEIEVRVSSRGAINFSNTVTYKLEGAINSIPGYNQTHNSTGITRNADGDIIFSLQNESGANQGIKVWRVNNDVEDYLPSSSNWVAMKIGPDGLLYAVRGIYAVYRENNGGIDNSPYAIGDPSESYRNLDFGVGNYLWVVGDNEDIIRADISDGSIERF
ncbi:MAG: IPT/TIG domain-containing protein, partial [Balneolaceae bacterium]